jgi:hypothetical protein
MYGGGTDELVDARSLRRAATLQDVVEHSDASQSPEADGGGEYLKSL